MLEKFQKLPSVIRECLGPDTFLDLGIARLGNELFQVKTIEGHDAILKIGTSYSAADIDDEVSRLRWINGRCKAPKLIAYTYDKESSWSVQTFVGEHAGHECIGALPTPTIIQGFAKTLKEIHETKIDDCPFVSLLQIELKVAEHRLKNDLIVNSEFENEVRERPSRVFDYLVNSQHIIKEDCFTHGDYSLPNVLFDIPKASVNESQVSGVVDWGQASVSDRHRDFMSVELTIRRNMDKNYIHTFYELYGIDSVDNERIRYYWLLDRFWAHFKHVS